jgi:hypothetical protein
LKGLGPEEDHDFGIQRSGHGSTCARLAHASYAEVSLLTRSG